MKNGLPGKCAHPDVIARMKLGMRRGLLEFLSYTQYHVHPFFSSEGEFARDVREGIETFAQILGRRPLGFHPPLESREVLQVESVEEGPAVELDGALELVPFQRCFEFSNVALDGLRIEANVECVQYRAGHRHPEMRLEGLGDVGRHQGDRIAAPNTPG